jgi:hypothetical protein
MKQHEATPDSSLSIFLVLAVRLISWLVDAEGIRLGERDVDGHVAFSGC